MKVPGVRAVTRMQGAPLTHQVGAHTVYKVH